MIRRELDAPQIVPPSEGQVHLAARKLPGGKALLVSAVSGQQPQVVVISLESGAQTVLVDGTNARVTPTSDLVFARLDSVWAVPFDVDRLEVVGSPLPVLEQVVQSTPFGTMNFDWADDGTLVYARAGTAGDSGAQTLVWVDREGREELLAAPPSRYDRPRV